LSKRVHVIDEDEFEFYKKLEEIENQKAKEIKLMESQSLEAFRVDSEKMKTVVVEAPVKKRPGEPLLGKIDAKKKTILVKPKNGIQPGNLDSSRKQKSTIIAQVSIVGDYGSDSD
jgi:hypothetical protein